MGIERRWHHHPAIVWSLGLEALVGGLAMASFTCREPVLMTNDRNSSRSALAGLLLVLGAMGGLALMAWFTIVLLDLKHLNTSGFTLP
jgi:hypothetical protein